MPRSYLMFGQAWRDVWQEDDCAPDAERLEDAWRRRYHEAYDHALADAIEDHGDAIFYRFGTRLACESYRGGCSISELSE